VNLVAALKLSTSKIPSAFQKRLEKREFLL